MSPGDERVVDREVAIDTADDQLRLDRDSLSGQRPLFHQQRGHSGESSPGRFSRPSDAGDHGVPVILAMLSKQSSSLTFGRHLPMESLSVLHQPPTIVGARPGSVAVPSMST